MFSMNGTKSADKCYFLLHSLEHGSDGAHMAFSVLSLPLSLSLRYLIALYPVRCQLSRGLRPLWLPSDRRQHVARLTAHIVRETRRHATRAPRFRPAGGRSVILANWFGLALPGPHSNSTLLKCTVVIIRILGLKHKR